jgi:hypothetical protein
MQYFSQIIRIRETEKGTDLIVHVPGEQIQREITKYRNGSIINSEIRIDDGRVITAEQRKKIFATIKDISLYTGDHPEELRAWLLYDYCIQTGEMPFSLSNCSISQARDYITFIIDFILREDIPLSDVALNRTDDIDRYLWSCIKYKRCAICGQAGEIHHWDAVGMGRDRREIDDSQNKKMCLCRKHHTEAHSMGNSAFEKKYHVYGIKYQEEVE